MAGVPGTGKTETVHEVMRQLRGRAESGEMPAFRFVEINALRLPSPQHAYVHLFRVCFLPPSYFWNYLSQEVIEDRSQWRAESSLDLRSRPW